MRTFRAELLRSANRATAAFLLLCLAITVFAVYNAGHQHQTPLWGFGQVAIFTATLLMGRAAAVAAGDFSGGTIRPWLISGPSRGRACLGKSGASICIAVGFTVVAGLLNYAVSGMVGSVPTLHDALVATGRLGIACVAFTLFGHAVGVLTRSVPVALTVTLGWILPVEHLLDSGPSADRWLPGLVLQRITTGQVGTTGTWAGVLAHAVVPFVILELVALVVFRRRDINS